MKKKLLNSMRVLLVAVLLGVGATSAWADDTPYNITSSHSGYVHKANPDVNYNGASLESLPVYYSQYRNWTQSKWKYTGSISFRSDDAKVAYYKFSLSDIAEATGTFKSATLKVHYIGKSGGTAAITAVGYNDISWTGSTLTYSSISNNGSLSLGYTVDYDGSYSLLDTETVGDPTADTDLEIDASTYVKSAIDGNKTDVAFAFTNNVAQTASFATTATLTIVYTSSVATTYTIQYHDGEGNELKADKEYDTFTGNEFTASASDMAAFYSNDYTKKYTYASGNSVETAVATAASNVITLVFDVADNAQYTHTINATGDVSKDNIASITLYEGQTGTVYYNKYIEDNGSWYSIASNGNSGTSISYGVSVSAAGSTNKSYSAASITNFIEVEDMNKSHSWATEGTASRASNGKAPRFYSNSYAFTEPIAEGGTYNITLGGRGVAKDATVDLYVGTKSSSTAVKDDMVSKGTFSSWSNGGIAEITINNVVVEPGQVIVLKNPSSENNCYVEADYIYYTKTADYTVSATLGTNGYATFASPYALDLTTANLPTGLTAYKAAVSGTTVTFTALDQTVPANTGVLLKGTASKTYSIPVVASGTTVSDNAFLVNDGGTTFTGDANYYYFGLMKNTLTFGVFDPSDVAIPADKAYLKVLKSSIGASRALTVMFGDETAGISQMENGRLNNEESVFSLSGQRVSQPTKGLYIVNGKKVIIK